MVRSRASWGWENRWRNDGFKTVRSERPSRAEKSRFLRLILPHAVVLGFAQMLLLCGCGIEEYVLLAKPDVSLYSTTTVDIKHASANSSSDVFTGYDVLYRLFDDQSKAGAVNGVDDQLEATSPDVLVQRLKAAKFQSIIGLEGEKVIVDAVFNPGSSIDVTFRFTLDETGSVLRNSLKSDIVIRRSSYKVNTGHYRTFADFETEDALQASDCAYAPSNPSTVFFRGYVIATGINMSNLKQYYSVPVLIGGGALTLTR